LRNEVKRLNSASTFQQILEKTNEEKRQKYQWLWDHPSSRLLLEGNADMVKLIEDSKERPGSIEGWKYKVRSVCIKNPTLGAHNVYRSQRTH
jgi:hypothetical protein